MANKKIIAVAILIVAAIFLPIVIDNDYYHQLFVMVLIYATLALSIDIIMGRMGQFSFGHQAFFGSGAFTTAVLTTRLGWPWWIGFIAGVVFSTLLGLAVGLIALKRSRGFYLGIVTLGFGQIVLLLATNMFWLTGGIRGLPNLPFASFPIPFWGRFELDTEYKFYYFALLILAITLYLIHFWVRSKTGRAVIAISQNEDLAKSVGINTYKYYVLAFTFACTLAGLAGVTYAHFTTHVSVSTLSGDYLFAMLVMVLVGGKGTFVGPILGAIIWIFLPEFLAFSLEFQKLIFGVILVTVILFMRQGIYPSLTAIWRFFRQKSTQGSL